MWGDVARPAMSVAVVHCVFPPPRQAVSCERDSKPQKDCCDALPMSNKCEFKESLSEISQTTEVAPGASIHNSRWLDPRHFLEVIRVRGRKCNACSFSLYYLSYHIPHVGYWIRNMSVLYLWPKTSRLLLEDELCQTGECVFVFMLLMMTV